MEPLNVRTVNFLSGAAIGVASDHGPGEAAGEILRALGAEVVDVGKVDLSGPKDLVMSQARGLDAVICDLTLERCDGDYLRLASEVNQRVWVTISAFGLDGPAGGYRGSDLVCAAAGGLLNAVVDHDGHPQSLAGEQAILAIGQASALAVLHGLSLWRRDRSPVHLDVSGQEAVAFCSLQQECAHYLGNCEGKPGAARYSAPSGVFQCRDGMIRMVVIDDHQWAAVTRAMGRDSWSGRFPTIADRRENSDLINAAVSEWTAEQEKFECERELQAIGVPATAVRTPAELASSPQFADRGFFAAEGQETTVLPAIVRWTDERPPTSSPHSLEDLKVVELTHVLAGPLTGAILGAMGAEVLRLEDNQRPDLYRRTGPFVSGIPGSERAAYFLAANHSKMSAAGNLEQDHSLLNEALNWSNVAIENVGPRRLRRIGAERWFESDRGRKRLVVGISGLGRLGPQSHFRGYAANFHAFGGLEAATREAVGGDITIETAFADYCTAIWAATLAAAWAIGGMPQGAVIDLSMAEVVASKIRPNAGPATETRQARPDVANWVITAPGGGFLAASLHTPPGHAHGPGNYECLIPQPDSDHHGPPAAIRRAIASHAEGGDIVAELQDLGIASYVANTAEGLLGDAQLQYREFFVAFDHPAVGRARTVALPWKVAGQPRSAYGRSPLLGEHTRRFADQLAGQRAGHTSPRWDE